MECGDTLSVLTGGLFCKEEKRDITKQIWQCRMKNTSVKENEQLRNMGKTKARKSKTSQPS